VRWESLEEGKWGRLARRQTQEEEGAADHVKCRVKDNGSRNNEGNSKRRRETGFQIR
jgi:hypothetical protein